MKRFARHAFLVFLIVFGLSGCSLRHVSAAPDYSVSAPLPIRVGIVVDEQTKSYAGTSRQYLDEADRSGPVIIGLWKEMGLFESITYPHREGDPVDGVLKITITGGEVALGLVRGTVMGAELLATLLTMKLAGPLMVYTVPFEHDAVVVLSKGATEVARYSVHVESTVILNMNPYDKSQLDEGKPKAEVVQRQKLAVEIARKLDADRALIAKAFGR